MCYTYIFGQYETDMSSTVKPKKKQSVWVLIILPSYGVAKIIWYDKNSKKNSFAPGTLQILYWPSVAIDAANSQCHFLLFMLSYYGNNLKNHV